MYRLRFPCSSRKSLQKLRGSGRFDEVAVTFVLNELVKGNALAERYQNHPLQGEYAGCFECHIKSDLLLIYEIDDLEKTLTVVDIGSHSDLFG